MRIRRNRKYIYDLSAVFFTLFFIFMICANDCVRYSDNILFQNEKNNESNENESKLNKKDNNLRKSLINEDDSYSGIGQSFNVTHWANRTFFGTGVTFEEGKEGIFQFPIGESPWEGYQINANINNLYDERNWINGTFNFGASDSQSDSHNDSATHPKINNNYFQNWSFHTDDVLKRTNVSIYNEKKIHDLLDDLYEDVNPRPAQIINDALDDAYPVFLDWIKASSAAKVINNTLEDIKGETGIIQSAFDFFNNETFANNYTKLIGSEVMEGVSENRTLGLKSLNYTQNATRLLLFGSVDVMGIIQQNATGKGDIGLVNGTGISEYLKLYDWATNGTGDSQTWNDTMTDGYNCTWSQIEALALYIEQDYLYAHIVPDYVNDTHGYLLPDFASLQTRKFYFNHPDFTFESNGIALLYTGGPNVKGISEYWDPIQLSGNLSFTINATTFVLDGSPKGFPGLLEDLTDGTTYRNFSILMVNATDGKDSYMRDYGSLSDLDQQEILAKGYNCSWLQLFNVSEYLINYIEAKLYPAYDTNYSEVEINIREHFFNNINFEFNFSASLKGISDYWDAGNLSFTREAQERILYGYVNATITLPGIIEDIEVGLGWENFLKLYGWAINDTDDSQKWNDTMQSGYNCTWDQIEYMAEYLLQYTSEFYTQFLTENDMSGNYINEGEGVHYLELNMLKQWNYIEDTGVSTVFWDHYDPGDKCMWNTSFFVERGKLIDCTIILDINVDNHIAADVIAVSFYINNVKVYAKGTQSIYDDEGSGWQEWEIPMEEWTNKTNAFPEILNGTNKHKISIALEALGSNSHNIPGEDRQRVYIDNFRLKTKAEVKPNQIGLKINSTQVNSMDWGKGNITLNPTENWKNFDGYANLSLITTEDYPLDTYTISLETDTNFYITKHALETTYETLFSSPGSYFIVRNESKVYWQFYDYLDVPTGYSEFNLSIIIPEDFNITRVYEPQYPTLNRIQSCDNSTRGVFIVHVLNISETPNGFWKFEGVSPRYCQEFKMYVNNSGTWDERRIVDSGNKINFRANFSVMNQYLDISSYISDTAARLLIRFPNGSIWHEKTQILNLESDGFVNFTSFIVPNYSSPQYVVGRYEAIITWNNSRYSSKPNETSIQVIPFQVNHPSRLTSYQDQTYYEGVLEDSIIILRVNFTDLINLDNITDADVYSYGLPFPSGKKLNFSEIDDGFYLLEFNVTGAELGNNTLIVNADASLYKTGQIEFIVNVIRETELTAKEYPLLITSWNENFTINFNYTEKESGTGVSGEVSHDWNGETNIKSSAPGIFNITCNSSSYAVNQQHTLTLSLTHKNYSSQTIQVEIEIVERDTYIDEIRLNDNSQKNLTLNSGEFLNITLKYKDSLTSGNYIENGTIRLLGDGGLNKSIKENGILKNYTLAFNTTELYVGANILTINAKRDNYSLASETITIVIKAKKTKHQLFLNNNNFTEGGLLIVERNQEINFKANFYDRLSSNHIPNADIELLNLGIFGADPNLDQYNLTINSNDLDIGVNLLVIYYEASNYESITARVSIEVKQLESNLTLYLNSIKKTIEPSVDLYYGGMVNFTAFYFDNITGEFLQNAIVNIQGENSKLNFTRIDDSQQYTFLFNTSQVEIGIHYFTIIASRSDYETRTISISVNVKVLKAKIEMEEGDPILNIIPGDSIKIRVILKDINTGENITGAKITFTWLFGEGEFIETSELGVYEADLENVAEGNYVITLSVDAGEFYEVDRYQISLNVGSESESNLLLLIIAITIISGAIGIGVYTILYIYIFKYPKPVRKVRKYRKAVNKSKDAPKKPIATRADVLKHVHERNLEIIEIPKQSKLSQAKTGAKSSNSSHERSMTSGGANL